MMLFVPILCFKMKCIILQRVESCMWNQLGHGLQPMVHAVDYDTTLARVKQRQKWFNVCGVLIGIENRNCTSLSHAIQVS